MTALRRRGGRERRRRTSERSRERSKTRGACASWRGCRSAGRWVRLSGDALLPFTFRLRTTTASPWSGRTPSSHSASERSWSDRRTWRWRREPRGAGGKETAETVRCKVEFTEDPAASAGICRWTAWRRRRRGRRRRGGGAPSRRGAATRGFEPPKEEDPRTASAIPRWCCAGFARATDPWRGRGEVQRDEILRRFCRDPPPPPSEIDGGSTRGASRGTSRTSDDDSGTESDESRSDSSGAATDPPHWFGATGSTRGGNSKRRLRDRRPRHPTVRSVPSEDTTSGPTWRRCSRRWRGPTGSRRREARRCDGRRRTRADLIPGRFRRSRKKAEEHGRGQGSAARGKPARDGDSYSVGRAQDVRRAADEERR